MKRKKGSKGGFKKVKRNDSLMENNPNSSPFSIEGEDAIGQIDEGQVNFELDVEQPTTAPNKFAKASSSDPDVANDKSTIKAGHSRVKVKLKASKLLEPHKSSSNVPILSVHEPSDTDKSNPRLVMDMNETTSGKIDISFSDGQTLEAGNIVPENQRRKPGSIKIKSSRLSSDSVKELQSDRVMVFSDNEKISDLSLPRNSEQLESKKAHRDSLYNMEELRSALAVIRKVMKMDAAEPFNAPVNTVALGIPDYYDIIDTPMDFGSICHDLEHGKKYKNSQDVYIDVQFIWNNCYKYNNKGDYIVDLMKRVKKNFMKYWTAAGLCTDMPSGILKSVQVEDVLRSRDKSTSKIKSKHKRRRYGIDGHKSNCLCAVCVVRRRRKEREEHSSVAERNTMVTHASFPDEPKLEGSSADNPCSEGTASSLDHSLETDADIEMDEAVKVVRAVNFEPAGSNEPERLSMGREIELYPNATNNAICNISHEDDAKDDSNPHSHDQDWHPSGSPSGKKNEDDDDDDEIQQIVLHQNDQEIKVLPNPPQQENHSVLWLCRDLFLGNQLRSVWNGPHSLNRRLPPARENKAIQSALATFMNMH